MCYVLFMYNQYSYGCLSIFVLFILLQDTPAEVHLLILYFDIQQIRHFNTFYLLSSNNFAFLTNSESITL